MKRFGVNRRVTAALAVGLLLGGFGRTVARAQVEASAAQGQGVSGALSWAAKVEVLGASGETLRIVNGTLLQNGVVVQTHALAGSTRVRIQSRDGQSWESATVVSTHPLLGLSLVQLPESPPRPAVFPPSGSYMAKSRVILFNGPGVGPDSLPARIYQNFQLRDFPDLCPIDAGIVGAAPAVDSTGRFLGVACDLSDGPYEFGYIVPAGSVGTFTTGLGQPRPVTDFANTTRPRFEDDSSAVGLLFRGAALTQIGHLDDARRFLRLAEKRDASLSEIYYWAGRALFAQEQYPQAAEEFLYAAGKDSTNYQVLHRAGEALHMAADYAGAEKMYRRAIEVKPDAALSYVTLGVTYLKLEQDREAEEAWRASIRIDPRFQEGIAYFNLASMMKHGGRAAAVDSICQELAKLDQSWEQRLREALEKKHH